MGENQFFDESNDKIRYCGHTIHTHVVSTTVYNSPVVLSSFAVFDTNKNTHISRKLSM